MAGDRKRFLEKVNFRIATLLFAALSMFSCAWLVPRKPASDFTRLVELMRLEDRSTPVYPFNDFVKRFDQSGHKTTLAYFNKRSDLINKIRKDLGGKELQWRLEDFEQRLLYVPEIREEYAALYENYCHEVIDFVLQETELDNPFANIETLDHLRPEIPQKKGVAVFLVHNLAREYVGTYSFFNEKHKKEVKISLRGRMFIGEIGSYSSMLEIQDDGTVQFKRNRYTIWQNSAELPYNALIVPIEETLHIALRQSTEAAILEQLRALDQKTYPEVEQVVEHWISIEEAVVGGLVDILFSQVAARYIAGFPRSEIEKSVNSKFRTKKYRHLRKGIEVVKAIGFKAAIGIYRRHPEKFRDMVVSGTDPALKL